MPCFSLYKHFSFQSSDAWEEKNGKSRIEIDGASRESWYSTLCSEISKTLHVFSSPSLGISSLPSVIDNCLGMVFVLKIFIFSKVMKDKTTILSYFSVPGNLSRIPHHFLHTYYLSVRVNNTIFQTTEKLEMNTQFCRRSHICWIAAKNKSLGVANGKAKHNSIIGNLRAMVFRVVSFSSPFRKKNREDERRRRRRKEALEKV